jgi:hypothetical protein
MPAPNDLVTITEATANTSVVFKPSEFVSASIITSSTKIFVYIKTKYSVDGDAAWSQGIGAPLPPFMLLLGYPTGLTTAQASTAIASVYTAVNTYYTAVNS